MIIMDTRLLSDLRNCRVAVTTVRGAEYVALLRAITPKDEFIFADERGRETWTPVADVASVVAAPQTCEACGRAFQNLAERPRCADCEREHARRQPVASETCQTCGNGGAVYSPLAKQFRCIHCHAKAGTLTGLGPEVRVLTGRDLAACRTADESDSRHTWVKAKSSWVCSQCEAKTFSKPKSA